MRATGIVRKVDHLGRVVVPKETRDYFGIQKGDPVEFFTDGEGIYIRKYSPGCVFCGDSRDLITFKETLVCGKCSKEMGRGKR